MPFTILIFPPYCWDTHWDSASPSPHTERAAGAVPSGSSIPGTGAQSVAPAGMGQALIQPPGRISALGKLLAGEERAALGGSETRAASHAWVPATGPPPAPQLQLPAGALPITLPSGLQVQAWSTRTLHFPHHDRCRVFSPPAQA